MKFILCFPPSNQISVQNTQLFSYHLLSLRIREIKPLFVPAQGGRMEIIMNRLTKKLLASSAALCFCFSSLSAYAAQITVSDKSITLNKNDKDISFDIYIETDNAFAGAEFGIKPSLDDVKFLSLVLSDELKNESKVQTVKDGCLYFGFFSNTNKYSAEKKKIATLNYSYSGSGERSISLIESKIVTVDENNKTNGDTSSKPFTVTITRSGGGISGGGSSGSGGSTKKPDVTVPDTSNPYSDKKFTDVTGHWAEDDIYSGVKNGLFAGISDTLFDPDGTVTRAMAVTVLGRFSKDSADKYGSVFNDVSKDKYYANYVFWGAENGVVKGVSETEFAPESFVLREQISAMIVRYLNYKGILLPDGSAEIKNHSDYKQISDYAKEDMAICYEMGLIKGYDNGLIDPKGNLTRAQLASIMARLSAFIENNR